MAEVFGYEMCTKVQAQAIPVCLTGVDTLAKAKTGTGKTIGFMIPAIEKVGLEQERCRLDLCASGIVGTTGCGVHCTMCKVAARLASYPTWFFPCTLLCYSQLLREPPRAGQVGALVLSPTRELAMQIHTETEKLLRFHKLKVQVRQNRRHRMAASRLLVQLQSHKCNIHYMPTHFKCDICLWRRLLGSIWNWFSRFNIVAACCICSLSLEAPTSTLRPSACRTALHTSSWARPAAAWTT